MATLRTTPSAAGATTHAARRLLGALTFLVSLSPPHVNLNIPRDVAFLAASVAGLGSTRLAALAGDMAFLVAVVAYFVISMWLGGETEVREANQVGVPFLGQERAWWSAAPQLKLRQSAASEGTLSASHTSRDPLWMIGGFRLTDWKVSICCDPRSMSLTTYVELLSVSEFSEV
jgi:hypothetical protein